ncbi:MAG TPA: phytanoyl-CoA dioxygenase family protein [Burkholderiales bacterium]|nr:phytanoyl-CoA dioxygenase family protein [Burkholderiales bacterium]
MPLQNLKRSATDYARYWRWRWIKNGADASRHVWQPLPLDDIARGIVESLREQGIVRISDVSDPELFAELRAQATGLLDKAWDPQRQRPYSTVADSKGDRAALGEKENKEFLVTLTPKTFTYDSVFVRYAVQPRFMAIADAYLGLRSQLRAVYLWLNYATGSEAASTQLWHRDGDDFMNLKIFTYLTDVDENHGPFAFIPGTQPFGYRRLAPKRSEYGRTDDVQMQALVDRKEWAVCTGVSGDTIFADTCGFHKGVKPTRGYRLMLMVHYASRAAVSGKDIHFSESPAGALSPAQIAAIE